MTKTEQTGLLQELQALEREYEAQHALLSRVMGERDRLSQDLQLEKEWRKKDVNNLIGDIEAKRELIAYVTAERDKLLSQNQNQTDWYQQRFNALRTWVENEVAPLSPEVAKRYWNIVANGTPSPHESADWSNTMHAANYRADVAEARLNAARADLARMLDLVPNGTRKEWERERDSIRNHISNIPSIAGMYIEPLIRTVERLLVLQASQASAAAQDEAADVTLTIEMVQHTEGEPYPEFDFAEVRRRAGDMSKPNVIALSNETLRAQIEKAHADSGKKTVKAYYYAVPVPR